ncbi:MAG: hypothetical protein RIS35_1603, partial [Pseudomonadota bacterium]
MFLDQVPAPDLAAVSVGNATLQYLEPLGFSSDGRALLVRATFTDDADALVPLRQGVWVYDVVDRHYVSCVNAAIAPALGVGSADFDVRDASLAGDGFAPNVVAQIVARTSPETSTLALIRPDGSVTPDLLAALTGGGTSTWIERQSLSLDGRFLALQTSDPSLSLPGQLDTNDTSDIYLVDLITGAVTRVSWVGGAEVSAPVVLGNVRTEANRVFVGFSSEAPFDRSDRNGVDASPGAATDAYVWSSAYDGTGLTGAITFMLASLSTRGLAAGYVDLDAPVLAVSAGALFGSAAGDLVEIDANDAVDVFLRSPAEFAMRASPEGLSEFENGATLVSASNDGRFVLFLSDSEEVAGETRVPQLVSLATDGGAWHLVSRAEEPADDVITSAVMSPSGAWVAFTTLAENLSSASTTSGGGSLFLVSSGFDTNRAPEVLAPIADQSATEDAAFAFVVPAGTFGDLDGDALTWSATRGDGGALPSWLGFDASTRTFSGTPDNGDVGSLGVKVTATDSSGAAATDTFTLTITNVNDAPGQLVTGTAGNDTLSGLAGDDRLDGGLGTDTAVFTGALSGYTVSRSGATLTVNDLSAGRDGIDTGTNLERLRFADMSVNLTVQAAGASISREALDRICELYV